MSEFEGAAAREVVDAEAPEVPAEEHGGVVSRRRWVEPVRTVAVAVIAVAAGAGITYVATPDYTETDDYAVAQAELAEREAGLNDWESELSVYDDEIAGLDRRTAELDNREADLDTRQADLDTRESGLDTRSAELDDREAAISTAEAEYEAGTIPGDGIFLVGTDIQAGQYRGNTGGGSCYWARLSGTSGDFDDLLANDNADGPTVVTIAESDVAFETNRCGEWHLLE